MSPVFDLLLIMVLFAACSTQEPKASRALRDLEGTPGGIGNATASVLIGWNQPVDSTKFGLAPNPKIDGKTLAQVIKSQSPGRDDGQLCSACHNKDEAQGGYGGSAAKNAASSLKPTDLISNRSWAGPEGWAVGFVKNSSKPANVKAVLQAWIDNGYQ